MVAERVPASRALPLSKRLRKETKLAHRLVEATHVARAFFRGKLTKETYAEGLARIYPVYVTMERALLALPPDSRLSPFVLPHVFRTQALTDDLAYFGVSPEPVREGASRRYADHVRSLVERAPSKLVAHAYVRYMADVSGGVLAGKVAQRALKLPSRRGLSFLSFPESLEPARFREDFRRRLDAFPSGEEEASTLVAEANLAFDLNRALADELWASV